MKLRHRTSHMRAAAKVTAAVATALTLTVVSACGAGADAGAQQDTSAQGQTIEVEDNNGTLTVPTNPQSVVALDNRTFQTLEDWGIKPVAAPRAIMSADSAFKNDDSILDIGNHIEPDLEKLVEAQPDLIINGQRFSGIQEDVKKYSGDTPLLTLEPREGQPLDEELKRQVTTLGQVFDKEDEATQLTEDFDASIERVKNAYDPNQKVMSVITSGGEINFSAPGAGRTLGPVYDMLDLTPALEVADASSDHQGDDISVEAIAQSNPDWILVMDRDAAISPNTGEEFSPANELLKDSQALTNVNAVKNDHIVYMPQDTYLDESIQTYTAFFNDIADSMESN